MSKLIPFKPIPKRQLRPGISVCMIVKNEEGNLERSIKSIDYLANEIIVVDTGSTDRTKEIALSRGAQVFDFTWCDDFSKARNFAISKASHAWILAVDADEGISEGDHEALQMATRYTFDAYVLIKRSYVNRPDLGGFQANDHKYEEATGYMGWCNEPNLLLFRNDKRFYYEGIIHESIEKSVMRAKGRVSILPVPVHHYGRWDMAKKEGYYFQMCKKRAELVGDAEALYTLGAHYDWFDKRDEALACFEKVLEKNPKYIRARFGMGLVLFKKGLLPKAEMYFEQYFEEGGDESLAMATYLQTLFSLGKPQAALSKYVAYREHNAPKKCFLPSKIVGLCLSKTDKNKAREYLEFALSLVKDEQIAAALELIKRGEVK